MMAAGDRVAAADSTERAIGSAGPFTVYSAGAMFSQHELATNVLIKEAVWRLSNGKFQLLLPQSIEVRAISAAHLRNVDLLGVVRADIILVRFDGLELDSGTVLEFALAKSLGKPVVILRCDHRHSLEGMQLSPDEGIDEPYNLMVKSWPRTIEVHSPSLLHYIGLLVEERQTAGGSDSFQATIKAELNTVQKSTDEIARKIIAGFEAVMKIKSPFPREYQELVYKAVRYSPGSGFDQLLTENELDGIIRRLRKNGTL